MEPIAKIIPSVVGKLGIDSPVAALTWECIRGEKGSYQGYPFVYQGCGVIEPLQLPSGRFIRRSCTCERAARKLQQQQFEQEQWMQRHSNRLYDWLGPRWTDYSLKNKTFSNFQFQRQPDAYDMAHEFVSLLSGTFILHGSYGTGKTHLLAAICNDLLKHQTSCLFATAPNLFRAMQARIQNKEDYTELIFRAIRTPLLVIDDVEKAKHSEFTEEVYFEIVDERTKAGRPIAISTNRLGDLEQYVGGAVCSRLSIGQIAVEMMGADYRLEL
jgi:DNA replication protein DnaC